MFRTDLLSIIRSLNTVFTAIGIAILVMLTVSRQFILLVMLTVC